MLDHLTFTGPRVPKEDCEVMLPLRYAETERQMGLGWASSGKASRPKDNAVPGESHQYARPTGASFARDPRGATAMASRQMTNQLPFILGLWETQSTHVGFVIIVPPHSFR